MFDYQAGEKYKLTLIMVGFAGLMAGMFFTMLLMPTPEPQSHQRQAPKWASNPDVTGGRGGPHMPAPIGSAQAAARGMQGDGDAAAAAAAARGGPAAAATLVSRSRRQV